MNETRVIYETIAAHAGHDAIVLATVVATRGSVPRHAGSRMTIDVAHDRIVGTIGGGCGEADVLRVAPEVARTGTPQLLRIELTDPIDSWSPAVCGGVMEVLMEPLRGRDALRQSGSAADALRARTDRRND